MKLIKRVRRVLCKVFGALPIDRKKCVFISFGGLSYSDNPRAISEALRELRPDAKIVWLFTDPDAKANLAPDYVKRARVNAPKALYHMATARTWVINTLAPDYMDKRPGQKYIQTWHGDRSFKVCLQKSGENGLRDAKMIDLCVSGSDYGERFYHSGFQYSGEIMRVGSPRDDALINPDPERIAEIKKSLGLADEKILLYAPTMRDDKAKFKVDLDFSAILDALSKRDGVKWIALARAHFMNRQLLGLENDARIKDVSAYEDMRDLLMITDVLVTDYSASAGDFPLTGKPVILYQRPEEQFTKKNRELYFEMCDSPFVVAETAEELLQKLLSAGESAKQNDEDILAFYGCGETGKASLSVAERISRYMDSRE